MRLERFVPAVDFSALCWASVAALPLFAWQVADTLIPFAPYEQSQRYLVAFPLFYAAVRYLVRTVGLVGISLAVGRFFQRRTGDLLSFSLTVNALVVTLLILSLEVPLEIVSIVGTRDSQFAQYLLIVTVLYDTSLIVAVGVSSRLYVAWRRSPDVSKSTSIFGIALALATITTIQSFDRPQATFGSLPIDILSSADHLAWRLVYAVGDVALFGSIAISVVRRSGREAQLGVILLAGIGAALAWWLVLYGPHRIESAIKTGFLPGNEFNPYPVGAIVRTALFGAAAGLFYFAVVKGITPRQFVLSLPTLISNARRWRPTNLDD